MSTRAGLRDPRRLRTVTAGLLLAATTSVLVAPPSPASATTLDATGVSFEFGVDGQTVTGTAVLGTVGGVAPGSFLLYAEVATISGTVIDARVTFVGGSNLGWFQPGFLRRLDAVTTGATPDEYLDHALRADVYNPGPGTMAEVRVEFFETGTQTPVTLSNLAANFYDIDARQAVEVDGVSTDSLSDNTVLTRTSAAAGSVRFAELNGISTNALTGSYTKTRAKVVFAATSTVTYRMFLSSNASGGSFEVDFSDGLAWEESDDGGTTFTSRSPVVFDTAAGPSRAVSASSPVVPTTVTSPTTTTPTTAPTTPTTAVPNTTPTTTAPPAPAPVPAPSGDLPALGSTQTLVTEDGLPVTVELVVENDEALVLRSQDFELRLRGACTTGCTITENSSGRETIHLDRSGGAHVSGFGFLPGSLVHVWIFSEPHYLGALLVAPDGTYEGTFPLEGIDVGGHTLQANGISFDNLPRSANLGIVVVDNNVPTPATAALPATGTTNHSLWATVLIAAGITLIAPSRRRRIID